jgi:hypothetical protein
MNKLICVECGCLFENARQYIETHGLDTPPYESYAGCPYCGGAFTETYKCDACNEWIVGQYIKLNSGERICEECYTTYELGEES